MITLAKVTPAAISKPVFVSTLLLELPVEPAVDVPAVGVAVGVGVGETDAAPL